MGQQGSMRRQQEENKVFSRQGECRREHEENPSRGSKRESKSERFCQAREDVASNLPPPYIHERSRPSQHQPRQAQSINPSLAGGGLSFSKVPMLLMLRPASASRRRFASISLQAYRWGRESKGKPALRQGRHHWLRQHACCRLEEVRKTIYSSATCTLE